MILKRNNLFTLVILVLLLSCKKDDATPPMADFFAYNAPCVAPCDVYFFESSERGSTYLYDFGNGTNSTLKDDTTTYQFPGYYTVSLEVTAENGAKDVKQKGIVILSADTMFITSVELVQYKNVTTSWTAWDAAETLGEDFYFNLKQNGSLYYNSDTLALSNKFPSDLPLSINLNQILVDDQGNYELLLYDKDTLSTDDFIGSVSFSPLDFNNSNSTIPPSQITLTNVSDSLTVKINILWLN